MKLKGKARNPRKEPASPYLSHSSRRAPAAPPALPTHSPPPRQAVAQRTRWRSRQRTRPPRASRECHRRRRTRSWASPRPSSAMQTPKRGSTWAWVRAPRGRGTQHAAQARVRAAAGRNTRPRRAYARPAAKKNTECGQGGKRLSTPRAVAALRRWRVFGAKTLGFVHLMRAAAQRRSCALARGLGKVAAGESAFDTLRRVGSLAHIPGFGRRGHGIAD